MRRLVLVLAAIASACSRDTGQVQQAGGEAVVARVRIGGVMPNPRDVPDERGEWVALHNEGSSEGTLDGWRLESSGDAGFAMPRGTRIAAGRTLVLARSLDRRENGGIDATIRLTGITLGNRTDWLVLRDAVGRTVDSIAWSSAAPGETVTHRAAAATTAPPVVAVPRDTGSIVPRQPAATSSGAPLEIRLLDVGQGDAILIRDGQSTVLIDGGPDAELLGRRLDALGLGRNTTFDVVVLTHAHADHYQGLRELFRGDRRLTVRYFYENGDPAPQQTLRRLRDSVSARVRRGTLLYRDTDDPCGDGRPICTVTMRGGAKLHILRPDPRGRSPNDRSVAVKLVARDSTFTMLLAGDTQQDGLRWLESSFARSPGLDVDLLKANHHGSCDGVSTRFLRLVSPSAVVASLAARNDYGHLHTRTKELLRAERIPWYRTDQNGELVIRVPGDGGARFTVGVARGTTNMNGPSDRGARCD